MHISFSLLGCAHASQGRRTRTQFTLDRKPWNLRPIKAHTDTHLETSDSTSCLARSNVVLVYAGRVR